MQDTPLSLTWTDTHLSVRCAQAIATALESATGFAPVDHAEAAQTTGFELDIPAALLWAHRQSGLALNVMGQDSFNGLLFGDTPTEDILPLDAAELAALTHEAAVLVERLRVYLRAKHTRARERLLGTDYSARDLLLGLVPGDLLQVNTEMGALPCVVTHLECTRSWAGVSYAIGLAHLGVCTNRALSWFRSHVSYAPQRRFTRKNAPVQLMTAQDLARAQALGREYLHLTQHARYARCDGALRLEQGWSTVELPLKGRVMVDPHGAAATLPRVAEAGSAFGPDYPASHPPAEVLHCVALFPQFAQGFSFQHKAWGFLRLDELRDIVFRDQAFDQLVLDPEVKDTVRTLVQHTHGALTDFIEGKSGGTTFLLYGPPGAGKTLTAEAVAETLHRPLYVVNVGELGTTPESLEKALRSVLRLAERWNAVVLLDEADIYLERRNTQDVERNALVGIFLRELEYYEGVLFLTTNRASELDPAVMSRVSLGLRYEPLECDSRLTVWHNLIDLAGVPRPAFDLRPFAALPFNGRQIKNVLRQAMILGHAQALPLQEAHLQRACRMALQFIEDCTPAPFEDAGHMKNKPVR